jgi:adenylyltransferase/sulfurtransferase
MDLSRYARQMVLAPFGRAGQEKLAKSAVLVVGCGALGSVQAELLARAGVGRLTIVDRDIPEIHNLQRQVLFDENDVAKRTPKAVAAADRLKTINSEIQISGLVADVTGENVEKLASDADVVLDGTDNFDTRFLLNDACVKLGRPWVYGGVLGTGGMVMPVEPGVGPCLRCIFTDPPDAASQPTCETQGVMNTAVMTIASMQVTEAFRILLGHGGGVHQLRMVDLWTGVNSAITALREADCPCCGLKKFEFLEQVKSTRTTVFCGRNAVQVSQPDGATFDPDGLKARLDGIGCVKQNGLLMEFEAEGRRMLIFPDGRVLVMGTTDPALARTLVARYVGC